MQGLRFIAGMKKTLLYLWDGNNETTFYIAPINEYKREVDILNWLVKNEIKGQKLIDFFKNETDREKGILIGVTYIINKLEGNYHLKRSLTAADL